MAQGPGPRPAATLAPPQADGEEVLVRLRIGDDSKQAFFRCSEGWIEAHPDAAFTAALPVAMGTASSLSLPPGVSPLLIENARSLQAILGTWGPSLAPVELRPKPPVRSRPRRSRGTAAFFTCGVDSFYTVLTRRAEIDAVVYAIGLDVGLDDPKRDLVAAEIKRVAAALGLPAILLETDLRAFSDPACDWERIYVGASLASIGHLLGSRFERVLIPATHSYRDLHPTGTHPLLDPLYSSDRVRVEHVDAVTRVAKLEYLAGSELAMTSLRVCWQPDVETVNCGRCAKCMRTMTGLRIAGALGRCTTLPGELSLREMAAGKVRTRRSLTYVKENLAVVEERGVDPDLAVALRRLVARGARTDAWEKTRALAGSTRWAARARLGTLRRRLGRRAGSS